MKNTSTPIPSSYGNINKQALIQFWVFYFSSFILHHLYSKFLLAQKYLSYYINASNGKGHGVHSPFVFDFITKVLQDKNEYEHYALIEKLRQQLLRDNTILEIEDFGAGSAVMKSNRRQVKAIAASSLKPKRFAQLLYRMVQYYKPATILELGTSLGITSSYLARGNQHATVYTCEGAAAIAAVAQKNFDTLQIKNISVIQGDFAKTLQPLLQQAGKVDFAFIDGNHRKQPTLDYFTQLLQYSNPSTILIFDDIHWSADMEAAWAIIQQHPAVTLTIDLFFIGIVLLHPDFKVKQHFAIRF
ncbi:MAG TPA: class I SAM-dependent methyltransferase [Ferruginibacter sp.]|nr:class I SAM-dependent methyltransferase [Ferruginibacter sp.]HMP20765.1 class I SAM-dependent methyltransferase [Ferruginibacter sp.]